MRIARFLLERKMQMPLLKVASTSFLPVHRMLFKLIAISMMVMQLLFQAMVLILVELVFIAAASICTKGPMPAHYLITSTQTTFFHFIGS